MKKKLFALLLALFYISAEAHHLSLFPSDVPASYLNYLKARLLIDDGQFREAEDALLKVIAADPKTPGPWRDLAGVYLATGQSQKALETADEIARRFPDDKDTVGFLAELYAQLSSYKQAAYYYEKLLESEPDNEGALIFLANYYYATDSHPEAIKYLNRLASQYPSNARIFTKLAEIYEKLKNYDDAIKNYRKSLELENGDKEAHLAISRIYEIMKDTQSAIAEYEAYLAEDPDNPVVLAYLGALYFYSGETEKARRHFERLAEISSETATSARIWLGALYADRNDIPSAIYQFEKAARTAPTATIYRYLAELYLRQRDFKSALGALESAARLEPGDYQTYFMKGLILMDTGKSGAAVREFTRAIDIKPDFEDALFYRAVAYDHLKNYTLMRKDFERLLVVNPHHHQSANYLAYSLAEKNTDLDKALELVGKALRDEPENPAYLDTLGWIYFKKKNLSEAEKIFERVLRLVKSDWEILYHTARVKEEIAATISPAAGTGGGTTNLKEKKLAEADFYYRLSLFCDPPKPHQVSDIKKHLKRVESLSSSPIFRTETTKNFARHLADITFLQPTSKQSDTAIKKDTGTLSELPSGIKIGYIASVVPTGLKIKGNITLQFGKEGIFTTEIYGLGLAPIIIKTVNDSDDVEFVPYQPADKFFADIKNAVLFLKKNFTGKIYETIAGYLGDGNTPLSKTDIATIPPDKNTGTAKISFTQDTLDTISYSDDNIRIEFKNYIFLNYGGEILKRLPRKIIIYMSGKKTLEISVGDISFITNNR